MGKLTEITQWEDDIYQLETSDPVVGGPDGVSNKPQKQLANRTQWLKQQLESTSDALAEHAKSRNHPDASLTAKGFVQLYSGVMSDSEILAATPKAVKIAMDNANSRLAKERNLADLTNVPLARQSLQLGNSATRNVGTTPDTVAAGDDSRITGALQKSQNGADIPDKGKFVQNLGLKETLNPTKRVSIGNIGVGAFDGSTPCINIGDSDSGFIGSADGVLDIYCNNTKVGYIDNAGLHMLADVLSTGAVRAGNAKKLSLTSNNNSALTATFNLWGDDNRPTVIELDDDQGWHLYSQRKTDGSILFTVNGDITANTLRAGDAIYQNNGNINGSIWGGWLNDFLNNNFNRKNTASLQDWGWVRDESTGFIMQWGTLGSSNGTYNFPRAFPVGCLAIFVTNTNQQGDAVDNAFGYPVSNSQFFAATKASTAGNVVNGYPVAWLALGR